MKIVLCIFVILVSLATPILAESTFFDNENDVFIMAPVAQQAQSQQQPAPAASGQVVGGGGGGGGRNPPAIPVITDFSIDKAILKVVLRQGQSKTETLNVKNIGTTIFDVKAYLNGISKFKISPDENIAAVTLQPNESKPIELTFKALENEKPDIYNAKIQLKSPDIEKDIYIIIEVDSAQPLFDVDVYVLPDSKKIFPGEELLLEVNLYNMRGFGSANVGVEYLIKDFKGNVVATEQETLEVETQAKFSRALLVPPDLRPGNYIALVKVAYADSIGLSSDIFEVNAKTLRLYSIQIKDYGFILLGAIIILAGIIIFSIYHFGYIKKKIPKAKVGAIKQLEEEIPQKPRKAKEKKEMLLSRYKLEKGKVFLVRDKNDKTCFAMFKDLTSTFPGLIIARVNPATLDYSKDRVKFIWLTESEGMNCINPSDIEDLYSEIKEFVKKQKEGIVLLQAINYIISGTNFKTLLRILRLLKDEISSSNNIIIVSFNQNVLGKEQAEKLKLEFNTI